MNNEALEAKVVEIEEDWDRSMGQRLVKILVLGTLGLLTSMGLEWGYDKIRDRNKTGANDAGEAVQELTE